MLGVEPKLRVMSQSTHTAAEAAAAIGCGVEAIVKSLLFEAGGLPLLVLASGPNRVDTAGLGERLGLTIGRADAKAVKRVTGYSIGGVPPFGHDEPVRTVMDATLLQLDTVWAAAGTANAIFPISSTELARITAAEVLPVS